MQNHIGIKAASSSVYDITIYTSSAFFSGTNANIKIRMYGTKGISDVYTFPYKRSEFETGSVDQFSVDFKKDLGDIVTLSIGHDNSGIWGSAWKPAKVQVQQRGSAKKFEFPVNRWLEAKSGQTTYVSVTRSGSGDCGAATQSRVVNGENAKKSQWPWQAQLKRTDGDSHHCGGTLIHPQYVLTASHCIDKISKTELTVVLGQHDLRVGEKSEQVFRIKEIIEHPDYSSKNINNDIALLKLDGAAMLTPHVNLACLPKHDEHIGAGNTCYVSGWGRLFGGGNIPRQLQHAVLPTVSNQECEKKMKVLNIPITENMLCAGGNAKSGCHGDSGGPFVCQRTDGRFTVQGAVSWGSPQCDVKDSYTVFARVSRYVDWIEKHVYSQYINESEM